MSYTIIMRDGTHRHTIDVDEVQRLLVREYGFTADYAKRLVANVPRDVSPAERLTAAVIANLYEGDEAGAPVRDSMTKRKHFRKSPA